MTRCPTVCRVAQWSGRSSDTPNELDEQEVGEEPSCEKAFKCFVGAVHALQSLELQGATVPQVREAQGDAGEGRAAQGEEGSVRHTW